MKPSISFFLLGGAFALPSALSASIPIPAVPPLKPKACSVCSSAPVSSSAQPTATLTPTSIFNSNSTSNSTSDSAPKGMSDNCAENKHDVILTSDYWKEKDMDQWFADWLDTHRDGDDDPSFYDQFAEYWGLGDSFDCAIDDECNVPQCTQIKRPTQVDEYEQANMYLASMANFNKYCARIYDALDGAKLDFAAIQGKIQQTFYPGIKSADMEGIQGLNAGSILVGLISAWAGPVREAANSFKEVFTGMARGVASTLAATDASVANLAELESLFTDRIDEVRREFVTMHDDIVRYEVYGETPSYELFADGAYVDKDEIAVLSSIGVEELRSYIREVFFAMLVSNSWIKQGAYIFSRKMDEDLCKEYEERDNVPPHLCYDGRISWLNKLKPSSFSGTTGLQKLPGVDELEKELGASVHDAMKSSIDAFNLGGYKYNPEDEIDDLLSGDVAEKAEAGSRQRGYWNIPVCQVESSDQYDEMDMDDPDDFAWRDIDSNMPDDDRSGSHATQICLCATAKDRDGVSIKDLKNPGSGSFRDLLDDRGNSKCNFEDMF